MNAGRLIAVNALIRTASAAIGQIMAFLVAARLTERLGVGAGALLVGMLGATFYVTELLLAPFFGRVADARGLVRVLRWGPAFGFASTVGAAAAAGAGLSTPLLAGALLATRVLEGVSAACAVPTTLALLAGETERRATSRMRLMAGFEIASLLGLIAGYVGGGITWDSLQISAMWIFAGVYGVAWVLTRGGAQIITGPPRAPVLMRSELAALLRTRGVTPFIVAWLAVNAVVGVWVQQAPFLLKLPERSTTQVLVGGYSGTTIGEIFGAWAAIFLLGIGLWSILAPGWPRRRALLVALGGMLLVVLSLALVNHGASHWVLAVGAAGVLVESGFTPAGFAHLADVTDGRAGARGMTMGVYSMLLGAGQLAGALVGSPLAARWQMDGVLVATAVLAVIAIAAVLQMPSAPPAEAGQASREPERRALQ